MHFSDGRTARPQHHARPCRDRLRRHQFRGPQAVFPGEGEPRYSGVNMWRGVTRWKPILSGASMVRAGWLSHGKMVIYPIRPAGADGLQLINWVAEIETPVYRKRDWNRRARSTISSARSLTGISTGSTCRRSFAPPTACWSFRWWIRTRCRAGAWPGDAARRRRPPDGAARLQRRRAGDPRCAGTVSALIETTIPLPRCGL